MSTTAYRPIPLRELERIVANWNAAHKVGAPVIVTMDSGEKRPTRTRSRAEVLSEHSAVIWLEGISGCYLLDRVKATAELPSDTEQRD